ncbi:hypothetical protein Q1695_004687 [Nippostrongylus brasiliensis]|nr:hypothetical protein Q1695_004687 [Nippostrongylus brasiliensis]
MLCWPAHRVPLLQSHQNLHSHIISCEKSTSNVIMWWMYTKSLSLANSSMQCLATNTGTNFMLTGLLGYFLFAETHSLLWCFGLSLVFIGVCLLVTDDKKKIG